MNENRVFVMESECVTEGLRKGDAEDGASFTHERKGSPEKNGKLASEKGWQGNATRG